MSEAEPKQVRPEVVDGHRRRCSRAADPAGLPPGTRRRRRRPPPRTSTSRSSLAERGKRDRQAQAWELLLTRSYDEPPSWQQIFDDLAPDGRTSELGTLYDALPGRRPGGVRAPVRGPVCRLSPATPAAR